MNEELQTWIQKVKEKDEASFTLLYEHCYEYAYQLAYRISKNDADAKDAAQEALYTVYCHIQDLQDEKAFYGWLKRIVISKCHAIFRKKKMQPIDPSAINKLTIEDHRNYMNPQESFHYHSEQDTLYRIMEDLKPKHREVLQLVYLKQLKLEEVAELLDIPLGTVKTRVLHGKKELRKRIQEFEKANGRSLEFHGDIVLAGISGFTIKKWFFQTKQWIQGNALIFSCGTALSILAVSGGVMAISDVQKNVSQTMPEQHASMPQVEIQPLQEKQEAYAFPSIPYQDKMIQNSRSAYYACLNFAYDETAMQNKSKEEWQEIQPIVEALKQSNDAYWKQLQERNWVANYEKYQNL